MTIVSGQSKLLERRSLLCRQALRLCFFLDKRLEETSCSGILSQCHMGSPTKREFIILPIMTHGIAFRLLFLWQGSQPCYFVRFMNTASVAPSLAAPRATRDFTLHPWCVTGTRFATLRRFDAAVASTATVTASAPATAAASVALPLLPPPLPWPTSSPFPPWPPLPFP